jgi:GAF domain-containing protein
VAVAFGLPEEEALKAVTINAAEFMGVADKVGSLEVGKEATLLITTGTPLDMTTNIMQSYIQGREIDMNDMQQAVLQEVFWRRSTSRRRRSRADARRAEQRAREQALEAERAARAQTEALLRLTEAMSVARTEQDVAEAVLRESLLAVGAVAGAVLRWVGNDRDMLEILHSTGFDVPELSTWQRFPVTLPSPITDAVRTAGVVSVSSIGEVEARYPSLVPLATVTGYGAWLAVPFVEHLQGTTEPPRILGGFGVAFPGAHAIAPEDEALLLAIGRQAAQALARARSYSELLVARATAEAARTRAERMRDLVGALSGAPDGSAVYDVLVQEARAALGAHAGAVALLDQDTQALRFVRWFGYPDGVMNEWLRVRWMSHCRLPTRCVHAPHSGCRRARLSPKGGRTSSREDRQLPPNHGRCFRS